MGLIQQLTKQENFTSTDKEIADYIVNHKDEICDYTVDRLARASYCSRASIIRFCRKLGLEGYREFTIAFSRELEKYHKDQKAIDMNYPFLGKDNSRDKEQRIADLMIEAIHTAQDEINTNLLEEAAKLIAQASVVSYYAKGNSLISAIGFANRLSKLGIHTENAGDYGELDSHISNLGKNDVFLSVTYSGANVPDGSTLMKLRKRGCRTIIVTADTGKCFDVAIVYPASEDYTDGKVATFYSQTVVSYCFNCLFAMIYAARQIQ